MKTVELFAGIGGFRLAADTRGWETVWANDVCPKACAVYRDRFGAEALVEGDFRQLVQTVPAHDVLTAGFPCQPFSSAGKKSGVRDARGTLFHIIAQSLSTHRPRFFVLENVKRLLTMEQGQHFATILGALVDLGYWVEWRLLNALHFGLPQNRERIFLLGARDVKLSADHLPARLATGTDLAALSELERGTLYEPDRWRSVHQHRERFPTWGLAHAGRCCAADLPSFSEATAPARLAAVLQPSVAPEFDFTEVTLRWLADNQPVNRFVNGVEILSNQRGGARMGYTIFGINGVAPTLTSTTSRHYERYYVGGRYRRLTNVEYARIQGFPDDHCRSSTLYDQYALLGNAVPPPMVRWVLNRLEIEGIARSSIPRQGHHASLFDYAD